MSPTPCPRDDCTATSHHYHTISTDGWSTPEGFGPHVPEDKPDPRPHVPEDPPHPSDGPPVRVHLTAATLDAAAAVCEVRGLPHLVARLDRAANEIRSQEDMEADA